MYNLYIADVFVWWNNPTDEYVDGSTVLLL